MTKPKSKAKPARLEGDWVTSREACAYLDICYPTLKKYIDQKRIVATQFVTGGKLRISVPSIRQFVESSKTCMEVL